MIWSALERIATQAVQLGIMLILAKKLGPDAFGMVGMLAVFIAISQTFVDSGFTSAVIRKKDRDESDFSTIFIFNSLVAFFCYGLLWLLAPLISNFYGKQELLSLTRIVTLVVPINALAIIQRIQLTVILDFKTQAKASILAAIVSGGAAITAAYYFELGVWSLVIQTIIFSCVTTITLMALNPWVPKKGFSLRSFKNLFGFGSKILLSSLLESIYSNLYAVIIGKFFDSGKVGQFIQANQLASVPAMTMTNILQRVTYPMLSNIQDDHVRLDKAYLLSIKLSCAVVFPFMSLLSIVATPVIVLLIGDIWRPASLLMSVLCCGYMLYPLHAINLNLLQVKGRSDLFLKLEILKKIIVSVMLFITIPLGLMAICTGIVITSYISLLINSHYAGRFSEVSLKVQLKEISCMWLICICAVTISFVLNANHLSNHIALSVINAVFFIIVYFLYFYFCQKKLSKIMLTFILKCKK